MKTILVIACTILLAACGGGGGGSGGGSSLGPALDRIQALTQSAPPVETPAQQSARAASVVSRSDSLIISTVRGETTSPNLPTFQLRSRCTGTTCVFTEPTTGLSETVSLSDLALESVPSQAIGTKHGITLIRAAGRHEGTDYRTLGAWMTHSAFTYQTERLTTDGVQIDARYGLVGGDLTGTRPTGTGTATWRGLMVGTPSSGSGRGDRLQGDATLTYNLDSTSLDATFTNIQNIDRLRAHSTSRVAFNNISVSANGTFGAGLTGNRIQGGFYGPGHAEAAGIFEQSNIVGAFGAKRQ